MGFIASTIAACLTLTLAGATPHLYNPYYNNYRYSVPYFSSFANYAGQGYGAYVPYSDNTLATYLATPNILPTLNVLAEAPYSISNKFTVVPMLVMSKETMKMVNNAEIMEVSKQKPTVTIKNEKNTFIQCTPAVKIVLDEPILVYSLRTNILFPTDILIQHQGYRLPIKVGAVIAPISQNTYVSTETPVYVNVVYAVPTRPIKVDYVNNVKDVIIRPDTQAVVVESKPIPERQNITIINFPDKEAEPVLTVDEEDEELVNRNPPIVLAPAGIVQSTQPQTFIEPFTNSKESAVLTALREEAAKQRL